jgi:hypothetical protein
MIDFIADEDFSDVKDELALDADEWIAKMLG